MLLPSSPGILGNHLHLVLLPSSPGTPGFCPHRVLWLQYLPEGRLELLSPRPWLLARALTHPSPGRNTALCLAHHPHGPSWLCLAISPSPAQPGLHPAAPPALPAAGPLCLGPDTGAASGLWPRPGCDSRSGREGARRARIQDRRVWDQPDASPSAAGSGAARLP